MYHQTHYLFSTDFKVSSMICYAILKIVGHQLVEINNFVFVLGGEYVNSENKKVVSSNVYW